MIDLCQPVDMAFAGRHLLRKFAKILLILVSPNGMETFTPSDGAPVLSHHPFRSMVALVRELWACGF